MEFVRFGGLSSVNQKGYDSTMPWFHSPPIRRGIYAFPLGCIEPFLLGGDRPTAKGSARYVRDRSGNLISTEDEEDLYTNMEIKPYLISASGTPFYHNRNFYKVYSTKERKDGKHYWTKPAPMKRFSYNDIIWHHLGERMKPSQILKENGSWTLSTMKNYMVAFSKESINLRLTSSFGESGGNINYAKGKFGSYSLDHIEVFIEKV